MDKKGRNENNELFDITMGSNSELVSLYIHQGLQQIIPKHIVKIYRDSGWAKANESYEKSNKQCRSRVNKKEMHKFAKSIEIKLVIENSSFEINYLDLNLNLKEHGYYPYKKPNNKINYINANSNHTPAILKRIPKMVENIWTKNSSNSTLFNSIKKKCTSLQNQ